jgi:hypothetical protein
MMESLFISDNLYHVLLIRNETSFCWRRPEIYFRAKAPPLIIHAMTGPVDNTDSMRPTAVPIERDRRSKLGHAVRLTDPC